MASAGEVAAYRATHGVAATAAHFGISERMVYKHCAAASAPAPVSAPAREQCVVAPLDSSITFRSGGLYRCPICQELMPPLPDQTLDDWNQRGCYLHHTRPGPECEPEPEPVQHGLVCGSEPEPVQDAAIPNPEPEPERIRIERVVVVKRYELSRRPGIALQLWSVVAANGYVSLAVVVASLLIWLSIAGVR